MAVGSRWRIWLGCAVLAAAGAMVGTVSAQSLEAGLAAPDEPIDAQGDVLDYNRKTGWIEGRGHVVIRKGDLELRADQVRVNSQTEDAQATGNVILRRGTEELYRGDRLDYNLRTGAGLVRKLTVEVPPFRLVESEQAEKTGPNRFLIQQGRITSCANPTNHLHYSLTGREVEIVPGESLTARGVVWYFGPVPCFYLPYWHSNLKEGAGFRFRPGHSSRMGFFLLSSYRWRINPDLKAETHLDLREKRGVGVGQDLSWNRDGQWSGLFSAYYADDQEPVADDEDPALKDVDQDRYRVKLRHQQTFEDVSYLFLQGEYVSDAYLREDFFESEYRESRTPENYVSYSRRYDKATVGALARFRVNDFYENLNRLPEANLDFMRQRLSDTPFYYESHNAASNLERLYPKGSGTDDYSAFRLDSRHLLHYPDKYFGFLNLIPRAGVRGTYFSKTRETDEFTADRLVYQTNVTVTAAGTTNTSVSVVQQTTTETVDAEGSGELRGSLEIGMEASMKAFRIWRGRDGMRRHIVQPYANYTYVPEPTLTPDDLFQFDEVDRVDERHDVRLGVRNKLQAKREKGAVDLADVDLFTTYNIFKEEGQDSIEEFRLDAELDPASWLLVELDGRYDVPGSQISDFNTRFLLRPEETWRFGLEHRYRVDESNLLSGDVEVDPSVRWTFGLNTRYEFEESRLEEQGLFVQRNLDCLSVRVGGSVLPGYTRTDGTERDDEVRVMLELWLTAFPQLRVGGKSGASW